MKSNQTLFLLLLLFGNFAIQAQNKSNPQNEFNVDFEEYTLENGLHIILHKDQSDPVVAVALTCHVGSAREIPGRTGFAHLFEHLLFLESENLGKGGLDKMSARIGGEGANGSTSRDRTNYFQTVPKDALEKMIWAEADKLGFFINTVTEPVLAKEKQVVKNEKRESYDNRPYGYNNEVINKNLYPVGHPYNWEVIGSLEDLQNATLEDVKNFYNKWYVPNNVTLTIAGDFDSQQTKIWIEKYFGEIKRGNDIPKIDKYAVTLPETKKLYFEDNFARLPQLTIVWPTVYEYHPDSYALEVLATYLSVGKNAPLYQALVENKKVTDAVSIYQNNSEIAGQYKLTVRAFDKTDLNLVLEGITEGFAKFEKEGISQKDLERIIAKQETDFYTNLSSVLGKGFQLAQYNLYTGSPSYIKNDIKNILAVTPADVMRVYQKYIKEKNYIASSFVPKNQASLALKNSTLAVIAEEKIIAGNEEAFDASIIANYPKTPSSFDRSIEPQYVDNPTIKTPKVWEEKLSSGIQLYGIENNEVPLVQFQLQIKGGLLLDKNSKIGTSNLVANLMTKGTKNKTTQELENEIEMLGATIKINSSNNAIIIYGSTLSKNYDQTIQLIEEIILEPRWDDSEFDLIKKSTLSQINQQKADPNSIAKNQFKKLIYGPDTKLSYALIGTESTVNDISIEDLKNYYSQNFSPSVSNFQIVGAIPMKKVLESLNNLNNNWTTKKVLTPIPFIASKPDKSTIYFYDVPGAKQSVLRIGAISLPATNPDFHLANVLNYRLGGGGFASQLLQQLREEKGYTYGINSSFEGNEYKAPFQISTSVRSNITFESLQLIKNILENYGKNYNVNDLEITQSYLIKSNARAFETLDAKLNMLNEICNYNYPIDYVKKQEIETKKATVSDIKKLSDKYLNTNQMIYLVVGDAETQLQKLEQIGFGKPVLLNPKK
ncbi:Peptidase M16, C-terminal [Flavobacteriaceae bacterium]